MKFYRIDTITNQAKKYGGFLNHYEPYQEIRNFRRINVKFEGFSNLPIIFERDTTYKNDEPISDFLLTNWAEIIVSKRIYNMLKSNYSNEIDFLILKDKKICPIEVKSGRSVNHISLDYFREKYNKRLGQAYILCRRDITEKNGILYLPLYMAQFL